MMQQVLALLPGVGMLQGCLKEQGLPMAMAEGTMMEKPLASVCGHMTLKEAFCY